MTFINITFGVIKFRFPNLYSSVQRSLRFSVLRLDRSTWTTWNASRVQRAQWFLLWLHQSTCRVKKIGEMIFAIVFLDLFFGRFCFFLQIGCWLLNCMCKWDTISGMFGCIWIFRNIFTGNLFLAEKVSPASRSCEGPVLQVLRGRFTHIPLRNRWMSWLYHVKQVYILVESDILNWYTLYSEPTSISSLFLVGWNDFVSYLHLDEFMETLVLMRRAHSFTRLMSERYHVPITSSM